MFVNSDSRRARRMSARLPASLLLRHNKLLLPLSLLFHLARFMVRTMPFRYAKSFAKITILALALAGEVIKRAIKGPFHYLRRYSLDFGNAGSKYRRFPTFTAFRISEIFSPLITFPFVKFPHAPILFPSMAIRVH